MAQAQELIQGEHVQITRLRCVVGSLSRLKNTALGLCGTVLDSPMIVRNSREEIVPDELQFYFKERDSLGMFLHILFNDVQIKPSRDCLVDLK